MPLAHAQKPLGGHRRVGTLDLHQLSVAESRSALNQPCSGQAEHHPTRRCHRLHPLRHPDLFTDGGVTEWPRTDFTGDHLTGVKSHPQLEADTVAVLHCDGKPLRLLLNAQGRKTSTNSVILQRHRRTEHRHDPVTGELVHRAAIARHHRRGAVDQFGHDLAQPLRTHRRRDIHRVDHVGEQHRHLLVLRRPADLCDRCTALATELGIRWQFGAARPTRQSRSCQRTATTVIHVRIVSLPVNDVRHIAVPRDTITQLAVCLLRRADRYRLREFGIHESDGAPDEKECRPKHQPPGYQACMMAQ